MKIGVAVTAFPKKTFIRGQEYEVHDLDEHSHDNEGQIQSQSALLERRIELLEKLLKIEDLIEKEESNVKPDPSIEEEIEESENPEEDREAKLDELYSERGTILQELGYTNSEHESAIKEANSLEENENEGRSIYDGH